MHKPQNAVIHLVQNHTIDYMLTQILELELSEYLAIMYGRELKLLIIIYLYMYMYIEIFHCSTHVQALLYM